MPAARLPGALPTGPESSSPGIRTGVRIPKVIWVRHPYALQLCTGPANLGATGGYPIFILMLVALMLIFPLASIALQAVSGEHHVLSALIASRWFVFWSVGVRLLLAGLRQIVQPRYTAEKILGIKAEDSLLLVRELGFANVAMGTGAVLSLWYPQWILPMGFVGSIFYALAGINHARDSHRNKLQTVAMISDLGAAVVLMMCCLALNYS
jgi:hypothetical protein